MRIIKQSLLIIALCVALIGLLCAKAAASIESIACIGTLTSHQWSGEATLGGESVSITNLNFNQDATVMTITDSNDQNPIPSPVHVTCLSATQFTVVYVTNGQDDPSMLNLTGQLLIVPKGGLYMSGTKKAYQENKELSVSLNLMPSQ